MKDVGFTWKFKPRSDTEYISQSNTKFLSKTYYLKTLTELKIIVTKCR